MHEMCIRDRVNILTIGLYVVGAFTLGKKFALKTMISTIIYPFFITSMTTLLNDIVITTNPLLGSLYGGICIGIGIGLVYRVGGSTGGMDIPPLVINKYTGIPLPRLVMCVDGLTVILGASTYGIEAAMIGLISVWICGQMIDKVITCLLYTSCYHRIRKRHYHQRHLCCHFICGSSRV